MGWFDRARRAPLVAPPIVAAWLWCCCALVLATVVLGAAVRLTGSGLSMVDWQPLRGALLPSDEAQWRAAFAAYQKFPEFHLVNPDMTLDGFKFIFAMEYAHRMLGRVIALVFALPLVVFIARRMLPRGLSWRLWLLFALGALQGLLGWWMVQSGLVSAPHVSHYRLLMHLLLAAVIYAYMLRLAVGVGVSRMRVHSLPTSASSAVRIAGFIALAMVLLMVASGALVAGTRGGFIFNDWPKMNAHLSGLDGWLPPQGLAMHPWWLNLLENPATIQFTHRWLALFALLAALGFALRLIGARQPRLGSAVLLIALAQVALGIATLTLRVPLALGIAHQAGAMALLGAIVIALAYNARAPVNASMTRQ